MGMYQIRIDRLAETVTLLDHGIILSKEEMESIVTCWESYKLDKEGEIK